MMTYCKRGTLSSLLSELPVAELTWAFASSNLTVRSPLVASSFALVSCKDQSRDTVSLLPNCTYIFASCFNHVQGCGHGMALPSPAAMWSPASGHDRYGKVSCHSRVTRQNFGALLDDVSMPIRSKSVR